MKFKSIKSNLQMFMTAIVLLSGLYLLTLYFNYIEKKADTTYHQILGLEKEFSAAVLKERIALNNPDTGIQVINLYQNIKTEAREIGFGENMVLLDQRSKLFNTLLDLNMRIEDQHNIVRNLMPSMVESVRYIHEHHIVYLKNLLRRGHTTQDWDTSEEFKRSSVKAAPELEIVNAAVTIQNQLLDVFSIFYKLNVTEQPSILKKEFQDNIKHFYDSVNTFEDYSLDAQDGLLVEELLITGRMFEKAFTVLLTGEIEFAAISKQMIQNSLAQAETFQQEREQIQARRRQLGKWLLAIQIISISVFLIIIVGLTLYVYRIMSAFVRTRRETNKIQKDITYSIEVAANDYEEFKLIFRALNSMAQTIDIQIKSLKRARSQLAAKVRERTADLELANQKLKKEIEDKVNSEAERLELETKLHRAKKMEAIGLLAGGVAHDLNNILSGIISYPELMLLDLPRTSPLRKPILTIKKTGEKAATIVNDLLTLSRSGIKVTELVHINTLIQDFLESPEFKKIKSYHKAVHVRTELNSEILNMLGSPVHLSKTIMNLIINALEAMPDGGELLIQTKNQYVDTAIQGYDDVAEGDYIVISISDNGIGISDEDLERIFEPFYTKKSMGRSGTGLGMAVVWGTVKDHNGYIDILSELNKGTSIKVYLPVTRKTNQETVSDLSLDDLMSRGQKILVIDDVREQREIASKMLEVFGYQVKAVSTGEAAVDCIKNGDLFDLLVLDMILGPGMDGLETYRKILEVNSDQKAVIASGFSETERVKETQRLGAGAYIRKPYTLKKIGYAVHAELNKIVA